MKAEIKGDTLVITLPIKEAASKTGKSLVIASSNGNKQTDLKYKDKTVVIGVNAYIANN